MFVALPAQATLVTGTASFADTGPSNNGLGFSGVFNGGNSFSFDLTAGTPMTVSDFLTITSVVTLGQFPGSATSNIQTSFSFTQPGPASGTVSGKGNEAITFSGIIATATGAITWGGPAAVDFGSGTVLDIALQNATFDVSNPLFVFPNQSVNIDATFTLTSGGNAVPEPATFVLLGTGLLGFAALRRRQDAV